MTIPAPGSIVRLTSSASVQFQHSIDLRVISVESRDRLTDWAWLEGYEINAAGEAVARRTVYVRVGGIRILNQPPGRYRRPAAKPAPRRRWQDWE